MSSKGPQERINKQKHLSDCFAVLNIEVPTAQLDSTEILKVDLEFHLGIQTNCSMVTFLTDGQIVLSSLHVNCYSYTISNILLNACSGRYVIV